MGFSNIFVRCPTKSSEEKSRYRILPASEALAQHNLEPLELVSFNLSFLTFPNLPSKIAKEHLGVLNGTSFSASVGALIAHESVSSVIFAEVSIHISGVFPIFANP